MNRLQDLGDEEDIKIWGLKWRCMRNTSLGRPEPFQSEAVYVATKVGERIFSISYIFGELHEYDYLEFKEVDKNNSSYQRYKKELEIDYDSKSFKNNMALLARAARNFNNFRFGVGMSRFGG